MSKRTYVPDRGELVLANFYPAAGREIDKRRPAVILTPRLYNRATGLCLAIPISTQLRPDPLYVAVPDGLLDRPSQVLCDRVRSLDFRERSMSPLDRKLPPDTMNQIIDVLLDLLDPA